MSTTNDAAQPGVERPSSVPYPPDEVVATFTDPAFGRVDFFNAATSGKRGPLSYLVAGDAVRGLPSKPFTLRSMLVPLLAELGLAGTIAADCVHARTVIVWTLPTGLDIERVARREEGPAFEIAIRAIACSLADEINLDALVEGVRTSLAIPPTGPFLREVGDYIELYAGLDRGRALGRLGRLCKDPSQTLDDYEDALGILQSEVLTYPTAPASPHRVWEPISPSDRVSSHYDRKKSFLVRPAVRAASSLVEDTALRFGIAATRDDPASTARGTMVLDADSVTPFPSLRALLAPGLRLVRVLGVGEHAHDGVPLVQPIPQGLFAPWDRIEDGLADSAWSPSCRTALHAARAELANAVGGPPLAILPVTREEILGFVGSSSLALSYLLELDRDDSPLPWQESSATKFDEPRVGSGGRSATIDLEVYRREVLAELLGILHPENLNPIRAVSERLLKLGRDLEALVNPAMAEAEAWGCPPDLLRAILGPLTAARAALANATVPRLTQADRTGAIVVAALAESAGRLGPVADERPGDSIDGEAQCE